MKSTRSTLRVIFCLVMTLAIVFSMASCDLKGAFESLGDGDFKGAWASITGKHKHAYTSAVTAPTCTAEGYTTYTCECGDTYKGDKVAPLGHDYKEKVTRFPTPNTEGVISNLCTRCGVHIDKYIDAVAFELPAVSEFLRTFVGTNVLEINAKDGEIILIKSIERVPSGDREYSKDYIAINPGYVLISGEGDEIYAYISFTMGMASYEDAGEDALPTYEEQIEFTLMVDGEDVAVSLKENDQISSNSYRLTELFYNALEHSFGIRYDELIEAIYVSGKSAALIPVIQGAIDAMSEVVLPEDGAGLEKLLDLIAGELVEVEGNTYKLNIAAISKFVEAAQGKSLTELVDEKYGDDTMARVESFVTSLPTAKLRDIANAALKFSERNGVALDDIYSLINYVVYLGTGEDFNIESEIITRYDMTLVAVVLELSGDTDTTVAEATEELTSNLREAFAQVKDLDIDELYNFFTFGDPEYKINGKKFSITSSLINEIGMLGEGIRAEITVSENGEPESIYVAVGNSFTLNAGYDEGGYSATVEYVVPDGDEVDSFKYLIDVNELDATYKVLYNGNEVYKIYLTFNEDGELLSADLITKEIVYVSSIVTDEDGNLTVDTKEVIQDGFTVKYVNNGDGTHTLEIDNGYDVLNVEATVTETEDAITVNGSFDTTTYLYDQITAIDNGTFSYTVKNDGSGANLEVKVTETTYDYTSNPPEEGADGPNYTYHYDNPKVFDLFSLELEFDATGSLTLDVISNWIYHGTSAGDPEGYYTANCMEDVVIKANVAQSDDKLTVEFGCKGFEGVNYHTFNMSAVYNVETFEVVGETPDESYTYYYITVLDTLTVSYSEDDDISFSFTYKVTETDEGVKISIDIDGFKYTEYTHEVVSDGYEFEYDGSPVTIIFYHTMGASQREILDKYIEEFNEMYPDIHVMHEQVGSYDDVRDRIKYEIASGYAPNIAYCYPEHVALYNVAGAVVPLDDFIDNYNVGLSAYQLEDFIDGFYAEGAAYDEEGTMYTLPMSKSTDLLYYNKTFFEEHGLSVPTTWEEMEAVCAAIKDIDPDCIPLGIDSEANLFITLCEQLGTPYTSATGDHFLFDTPENQAFVKMLREWYDKGYFTTAEFAGTYTSELFKNKISYMSIGSSAGARYQLPEAGPDGWPAFAVGITGIPQFDPANPKAVSQGPSLCMFKQDNPQEAAATWLFMKFLTTNADFQAEFSMASGYMPVIESVKNNPEYAAFLQNAYPTRSGINALAVKVALENSASFFRSAAFNGSDVARDQVGYLLQYCLLSPAHDIDAMIDEAFKKAIAECKYQTGN